MDFPNVSKLPTSKFREYQGYQDLCRENGFFLEFPRGILECDAGPSLRELLTSNPSLRLPCCETLNLIFQILTVYEKIKTKDLMNQNRFYLNLNNWFLRCHTLRTDNFHPKNLPTIEKVESFEVSYFKYGQKPLTPKPDHLEKILIHDIGVLAYRLLKGNFSNNFKDFENALYTENENLNEVVRVLLCEMLETKRFELSRCRVETQKIYQQFYFKLLIDVGDNPLYGILKEYSRVLHFFISHMLVSSAYQDVYYDTSVKAKVLMGRLIVFLRKTISMPISYQNFNREKLNFVEESDQETTLFIDFFENYCDILFLYLEGQQKLSDTQQEMKRFYQDYNLSTQISLSSLEAYALGNKIHGYPKEHLFLSDFYDFWTPFKKYEESLEIFAIKLKKTLDNAKKIYSILESYINPSLRLN